MAQLDHISQPRVAYDSQRQTASVSFGGARNGRQLLITCVFGLPVPGGGDEEAEAAVRAAARQLLLDAAEALSPVNQEETALASMLPLDVAMPHDGGTGPSVSN